METFNITPRKLYTEKIIELLKNDNVVIVLGLRRSGKSCIAKQLESELQEKYGNKIELVRHNCEKITKNRISGDYLIKHFQERHVEGTPCFILLDELTHVVEWEKVINHICQHSDCKLVLFSSNRRVLSSKLTAVQENKYGLVHALPLSLPEFIVFQGFQEITPENTPTCQKKYRRFGERDYTLEEIYKFYITYGGLPIMKPEYMDEERAWVVADGSYAAVVTRDILELGSCRGTTAITDSTLLRTIISIMAESIGNNISATWVGKRAAEYLQRPCSTKTIESYMRAILNANLFYIAERYDIRENRVMKTLAKYYIVDAGLHNYITGVRAEDEHPLLENKVFFELLRRGYQVCNGKRWNDEICLIARRGHERAYIQVGKGNLKDSIDYLISALIRIPDNYPKIVITFDSESKISSDGIIMINALEFLMGRSW